MRLPDCMFRVWCCSAPHTPGGHREVPPSLAHSCSPEVADRSRADSLAWWCSRCTPARSIPHCTHTGPGPHRPRPAARTARHTRAGCRTSRTSRAHSDTRSPSCSGREDSRGEPRSPGSRAPCSPGYTDTPPGPGSSRAGGRTPSHRRPPGRGLLSSPAGTGSCPQWSTHNGPGLSAGQHCRPPPPSSGLHEEPGWGAEGAAGGRAAVGPAGTTSSWALRLRLRLTNCESQQKLEKVSGPMLGTQTKLQGRR